MNIKETGLAFSNLNKRNRTDKIVLHHAAVSHASFQDIHRWHKNNGWAGIGYHFYVRKTGEVFRGRPIDTVGAHASGFNSTSIGICAEGNFQTETMGIEQQNAIIELIKYIKTIYPNVKIVGHGDLMATSCPGKNYPKSQIINGDSQMKELTSINDIVYELRIRNIITDTDLWIKKLKDSDVYWLARKTVQFLRKNNK